jgi:hypothetical protein
MTQTMAWMLDEYSKFHGHSPAVVTGKPIVCEKMWQQVTLVQIVFTKCNRKKKNAIVIIYFIFFSCRILVDHWAGMQQQGEVSCMLPRLYLLNMENVFLDQLL